MSSLATLRFWAISTVQINPMYNIIVITITLLCKTNNIKMRIKEINKCRYIIKLIMRIIRNRIIKINFRKIK